MAPAAAPAEEDHAALEADLVLDGSKLTTAAQQDRGDLFLLNWLSACEKAVERVPEVSRHALLQLGSERGQLVTRAQGRPSCHATG